MTIMESTAQGTSLKTTSFGEENRLYLIGFFLLWGLACFLLMGVIHKGDETIFFAEHRTEALNNFFIFCTHIGEGYVYALACTIFILLDRPKCIAIAINAAFVLLVSGALKYYFEHERPVRYFSDLLQQPELPNYIPDVVLLDGWTTSFPSGHTTSAFAFYSLLAFFVPNQAFKLFCLVCAVLVGVSRIYLVQHFLKDVTTGMLTGFIVALVVYWGYQRYINRKNRLNDVIT